MFFNPSWSMIITTSGLIASMNGLMTEAGWSEKHEGVFMMLPDANSDLLLVNMILLVSKFLESTSFSAM